MNEQQIFMTLKPAIERVLKTGTAGRALSPETNLFNVGLDSLGVMELIVDIENQFNITFGDDELSPELFERLGTLVSMIADKLSKVSQQQEANAA